MGNTPSQIPDTVLARHLFFPAAALFAAVAPWLLVLSISSGYPQIIDVSIHAKSMMFGFIGALIAGYLLGKINIKLLLAFFLLWLAGRFIEVFSSNIVLINLSYSTFGILLAIVVAPKFLVAKKWRNLAMAPLIAAIGCFPLISWLLDAATLSTNIYPNGFILLISLLMFFMAGRFITPAATRAFADIGLKIPHRVQPNIEAAVMILITIAFILSININLKQFAGAFSGLAAVLILVRLYRWKLHQLSWQFVDIWALAAGYAWLGLGLIIFSITLMTNHSITPSLHVITIGGVGTLSTSVIVRTMAKRKKPALFIYFLSMTLISICVISRFSMPLMLSNWQLLLNVTALCWSLNFTIVFLYCIKCLVSLQQNNKTNRSRRF